MIDFTTITACGECCEGWSKKINGECPVCIDILQDCYVEEDLFPMIFTEYEERDYGILFYNTKNKDSYDSNHAVIYKDRIHDLPLVLKDIELLRHNENLTYRVENEYLLQIHEPAEG